MATTILNTMLATRSDQPQSLLLSMLPVEMILDIADQAACAADAVSLALACKDLFSILFKYSLRRLDAHSREMLLLNLERDISWVVYCPAECKLLSFYFRDNRFFFYSVSYKIFPAFYTGGAILLLRMRLSTKLYIRFLQTRLVRNRRLFGPTHGIPLSCLSFMAIQFSSRLFMQSQRRTFIGTSRRAKWIGENLFLSSTWIVRVKGLELERQLISTESLRDFLRYMGLSSACHHCKVDGKGNSYFGVLHPSFDEAGERLSKNLAYEGMGACCVCETDWDVSISWSKRSLVFKLIMYNDLGCCSMPPDPKWLRLVRWDRYEGIRSSPRETCQGYVRRTWVNSGCQILTASPLCNKALD
ncbi:hypothetical protein F5X97DRAFT_337462 [Nemania serpens]|nr:hypothetical protein F5X97DRAFT_337462 [Nemania serpens]